MIEMSLLISEGRESSFCRRRAARRHTCNACLESLPLGAFNAEELDHGLASDGSIVRVFCEDNYEIMMREDRFKMVYYIGQEAGELYDMETDPHEFDNLWDRTEYAQCKETMLRQLLSWLATSTYYNAGYKRGRTRRYSMCWPQGKDSYLTGASAVERPVDL